MAGSVVEVSMSVVDGVDTEVAPIDAATFGTDGSESVV